MKPTKSAAIVLALAGVLFLVPPVKQVINGEPLTLSPALATAIGFFLGAVVSLVLSRKSGGRSGPPDVDVRGHVTAADGIQNRSRQRQYPGDSRSRPPIEHECDPRSDERQQARDDGPEKSLGQKFIIGVNRVASQTAYDSS
jgi:hypothetical protein